MDTPSRGRMTPFKRSLLDELAAFVRAVRKIAETYAKKTKPVGEDREAIELLKRIDERTETMSAELDRLTREVAENGTVIQSAIVLLEGLAERIRELATNPAELNALADELDAKEQALAAAITANTPTPEPTPEPE